MPTAGLTDNSQTLRCTACGAGWVETSLVDGKPGICVFCGAAGHIRVRLVALKRRSATAESGPILESGRQPWY